MTKKHGCAIECVIFRGYNKSFPDAVPVEGAVEDCFGKIAVWQKIGPLALPLKSGSKGIVTDRLLFESNCFQFFIPGHKITDDQCHLDNELPVGIHRCS